MIGICYIRVLKSNGLPPSPTLAETIFLGHISIVSAQFSLFISSYLINCDHSHVTWVNKSKSSIDIWEVRWIFPLTGRVCIIYGIYISRFTYNPCRSLIHTHNLVNLQALSPLPHVTSIICCLIQANVFEVAIMIPFIPNTWNAWPWNKYIAGLYLYIQ